jgi:hypothetical protein
MSKTNDNDSQTCTATTQAGKPCRYPAVPGSEPPLCELHGRIWLEPRGQAERQQYGRYLDLLDDDKMLARLEDRSPLGELILTRAILIRLVDHLLDPQSGTAESKSLVPLIFRGIKLVSDLLKQVGSEEVDGHWDAVLDRLSDELDIDV